MLPLISVIIPIYNVEKYIEETIISICSQTYSNLEIILVNDGSSDNSLNICKKYAESDKRIIIVNKKNGGLSSARNAGIDVSKGDYLIFIDGDDFIEKNSIEVLLHAFETNNNIGIASAPCFYSYNNDFTKIYKDEWNINSKRVISYKDFCIETLEKKTCFSACCKLYKKDLFNNLRFRENKKNEDTLFMFDLSFILEKEQLDMLEVPDKLYYYRVTPNSITHKTANPITIHYIENLYNMLQETSTYSIQEVLKKLLYNEIISYYFLVLINNDIKKRIKPELINKFYNIINTIRISSISKNYLKRNNKIKHYILCNKNNLIGIILLNLCTLLFNLLSIIKNKHV